MNEPLSSTEHPEVVFYYPSWMWYSDNAIKNLLLFFDGVALLVPEYMKERPEQLVPEIATPLLDANLLHLLEPEKMVDKAMTEKLAEALTDIITSGVLDPLAREQTRFQELSYSRLGGYGDAELTQMIIEELKARGLARNSEDGVSVPLHPKVRLLVLVLLSHILPPQGANFGLALEPATDRLEWVEALRDLFSLSSQPSAGNVVATDLETVGVDLSLVPLDEVLSFRTEHLEDYRAYRRSVKKFVRYLSLLPEDERAGELGDRIGEIKDRADVLNHRASKAWSGPVSSVFGLAGVGYSILSSDPTGVILGVISTFLGHRETKSADRCSFSYLFGAANIYPRHD